MQYVSTNEFAKDERQRTGSWHSGAVASDTIYNPSFGGDAHPWVAISIGLDSAPYVTLTGRGASLQGPLKQGSSCVAIRARTGDPLLWHMIGPGPVGRMRIGMPGRQRPTIGTARDRRAGSRARGGACPVQHLPKARAGSSRLPSVSNNEQS